MLKTISINECFGVFSKAITFARVKPWFASARMICPQRRRAHLAATWAGTQGGISVTEVARPMFRRQITEGSELSRPRPRHSIDGERGTIVLESTLAADSSCKSDRNPAWMPRSGTADPTPVELVHAKGFLPDLIFRQVRALHSLSRNTGKQHCPSEISASATVSMAAPETQSQPPQGTFSRRSGTIAQTDSSGPAPSLLQRMLTELAYRRLRSLAAGRES